ncbi:efflux RND transporter periplasmic adaptor subunit [Novosphingobium lentum]|uniref:efflux RND transporter periplasmic adaptor subunit n=1 Tax=Novosphingobium lentum TaxID=145287 RepID=UPI000AC73CD3|nr:efflux RND transporter periplasmic adaptor subunit [Novosphingobium lentum]
MSPRIKIAALAAAALLLLAGWWIFRPESPAAIAVKEQPEGGSRPLTIDQLERMGVRTATAKIASGVPLGTMPATVTLPPEARVAVTAPFPGAIRQVFVIAGQSVTRGQPLATMVSRDALQIGSNLTRARAQLGLARATANRAQQLVHAGVVAGARGQEANAALRQAEADVSESARILNIAGASGDGSITLRAPISGRVSSVAVQTGGPVDGMAAPFVIDASNTYQLDIQLPERLAGLVKPGMTVTLAGNVSGRILSVGSAIDPDTRSVLAKASIGAASGLIAGKSIMVSIEAGAGQQVIGVPTSAITRAQGNDVVFVKTPKGFAQRAVVVGGSAGGETVITEGLAAGEEVAISGLTEIKMTLGGE